MLFRVQLSKIWSIISQIETNSRRRDWLSSGDKTSYAKRVCTAHITKTCLTTKLNFAVKQKQCVML